MSASEKSANNCRVNEFIDVKQSSIHGKGAFARRSIRKGQFIGRFEGESTSKDGIYVLWVTDGGGVEIGIRGRNELRFLNHNSAPNAEFDGCELYSLRNVRPGTEILIDYGEGWREE